ncbi:hypothetical protein HDU92_008717 [Lobulomyces angularis]|nr:hypothetical protein HDU92_008717 [Lobulomyces angularis]
MDPTLLFPSTTLLFTEISQSSLPTLLPESSSSLETTNFTISVIDTTTTSTKTKTTKTKSTETTTDEDELTETQITIIPDFSPQKPTTLPEKKVIASLQPLGSTSRYSLTPSISESAAGLYENRFSIDKIITSDNSFTAEPESMEEC